MKEPPANMPLPDEPQDDAIIGSALWGSLAVILVLAVVGGGVAWILLRPAPPPPPRSATLELPEQRPEPPETVVPVAPFVDVTEQAGIDFVHENGARGEKLLPETMGAGCAFFDFDSDGDQDLLLVNAKPWPWDPSAGSHPSQPALYANDGTGTFRDVTAGSGLDISLYGTGVAVGDYDNDGRVDVFLAAVGSNRLFRNVGEGRFQDVTELSGTGGADDAWSTSCGWFDYNNDGRLDLFVCNYVTWSKEIDLGQDFRLVGVGRAYGPPTAFAGTFPYLYRNEGGGRFREVSSEAGVQVRNPVTGVPVAKSLGLVPVDLDHDGWMDVVVANDTVQNFLFHNQADGTFKEIAAVAGVAFDRRGQVRGAMGIDAECFRDETTIGIAIGNFANEMSALYVQQGGPLQFFDAAIATGLGPETRLELTFGLYFFDYDLDGRLDLLGANGHLEQEINKVQASQQYEQSPQLFWNAGPGGRSEFVRVPPENCGEDFCRRMVGRGAAYADIDGDGDLDVLLTGSGQRPRLLRNDQQLGHHWLRLRLVSRHGNRDALGAVVRLEAGELTLVRRVMPTRSYLSQVELPLTFGLGNRDRVDRIHIRWPDGSEEQRSGLEVDRLHRIEQADANPSSQAGGNAHGLDRVGR